MANTPLHDDEEESRRLLEQFIALEGSRMGITPQAPAAPAAPPAYEPPPAPPEPQRYDAQSAVEAFARGPQARSSYEEPPQSRPASKAPLIWATILDIALNKGVGAPQYVAALAKGGDDPYQNYMRREGAKDRASVRDAQARRGVLSPEEQAYRDARLELARKNTELRGDQIEGQAASLEERKQKYYDDTHPDSDKANAAREFLRKQGQDVSQLEALGYESIKSSLRPALKNDLEIAMGDKTAALAANKARAVAEATVDPKVETATRTAEATQPYKLELTEKGAQVRNQAAAESPQQALAERKHYSQQADQYAKETEFYRTGATFMQDAERVLARFAPGEDLPGVGTVDSRTPDAMLSKDALTIRQAQNWMNNAIQRADSGAAAPIPEELKFAIRSGAKTGATEAEFEAGMRAARMFLQGQLRSFAAGKEDAARDVLDRGGIGGWLGGKRTAAPQQQAQPEVFDDDELEEVRP